MKKLDYIEKEIAVCGGLDVRKMEQKRHEEEIKNLLFELFEEFEECEDIINALRSLHSAHEITSKDYDTIIKNYDQLLEEWLNSNQ